MFELLRTLKWNSVIVAVLTAIMGLALIINPDFATVTICLIVGWVLFISGAASVVLYLMGRRRMFGVVDLVRAVVELVLGLFIVLNPDSVVRFLGILFAAILMIHGIQDLSEAFAVRRYGDDRWIVTLALGVLSVLLGLLIFWNPFASSAFLMTVVGVALVYDGVSDLVIVLRVSRFAREFHKREKDDIIDM